MVAELLRLKLRLLANGFRVRRTALWSAFGIVLAAVGLVLLWGGAALAAELDPVTRHRVVVVTGAMVSLGAFLVPLVVSRSQLLHPRTLRLFGMRPPAIGAAVLLTTLVGPALILVPIAVTPLLLWRGPEAATAALAVPLIVVEGLLAARLGALVGAVLRYRPGVSALVGFVTWLLLVAGLVVVAAQLAPTVAELLPASWWRTALPILLALAPLRAPAIADTLSASPLGAFWRAPSHSAAGDADIVGQDFALGAVGIGVLALLWVASLAVQLRPTRRIPRARAASVPGWFRRLPSTPLGAVAARSFIYWMRDPRYRSALIVLPVVPAVTLLAMWVAGIPSPIAVLVPLPIVVLLIAWGTLHNDVAYDSTAVWSHLAAQISGVQDRVGRMLPVLALGVPVILVGVPLTALGHGDALIVPALFGVTAALLLGGLGVSSLLSVRFPYPATRPGDAPFQQPQVPGASGADAQVGSILLILLVAAPATTAMVLHLAGVAGPWTWVALVAGLVAGLGMLLIGIRSGGAAFDRRGPELLEFATRN